MTLSSAARRPRAPRSPLWGNSADDGVARVLRAGVFGTASVLLAGLAHVLGGGRLPDLGLGLLLVAATGTVAVVLTARRCRLGLLLTALGAEQLTLHALLASSGSASCAAMPAVHAGAMTCAPVDAAAPHGSTTLALLMLGGHALATVVTAWLLARGEAAVWGLADRLVRAALPAVTPWPAAPGARASSPLPARVVSPHRTDPPPRGPPTLLTGCRLTRAAKTSADSPDSNVRSAPGDRQVCTSPSRLSARPRHSSKELPCLQPARPRSRQLGVASPLSALLSVSLLSVPAVAAQAHVSVHADSTAAGSFSQITFRVPNESPTTGTVKLQVQLPQDTPFPFVSVKPVPGWKVSVAQAPLPKPIENEGTTITKAARTVTWTAVKGTQIAPGEYQEFSISAGPLPDAEALTLPAVQTYSDGKVVRWNEPMPASGDEPEHPAPTLEVAAAGEEGEGHTHGEPGAAGSPAPAAGPAAHGHGEQRVRHHGPGAGRRRPCRRSRRRCRRRPRASPCSTSLGRAAPALLPAGEQGVDRCS